MKWYDKMQNIDRRIIYLLLFLVTLTPLIRPIGIPLHPSDSTRDVYNIIEGLDPNKDIVLLSFDYGPGSGIDIHSIPTVIVEHLVKKGLPWVAVSFYPDGTLMADRIINDLLQRGVEMEYGVDYANLGYMAGDEASVRAFALDASIFTTDTRGNRVADLPIMQGISDVRDFSFVHGFTQYNIGTTGWLRQAVDPTGIDYAVGVVTVMVPGTIPFYNSGQLAGLIGGLRGAAEYEILIERPGQAVAMMDAQSMGHLLIIGFIVMGNIAYFASKRDEDKARTRRR